MARRDRPKKHRSRLFRVFKWVVLSGLIIGVLAIVGVAGLFWYYGRDLPDIDSINDYRPKQLTRVYSADGELIDVWVDSDLIYRTVVPLDDIPEVMRMAVLAAEDAAFYEHSGLDFTGMLRAAYHNLRTGTMSQGASTITQQVVKNLLLSPERSIRRKIQEALLAFRLEDRLSKDEILTLYLNEVYFGHNRYGVEEASRFYFGHSVSQITLPEAALMAGLLQSPERYTPFRHMDEALERRAYVLGQMWQKGMIEESAYRSALEEPVELADNAYPYVGAAPYFTRTVRQLLARELGEERILTGGLEVHTTVRLDHQRAADEAVRAALREYDERHGYYQAADHLEPEVIDAFRAEHAVDQVVEGEVYSVVVTGQGEGVLRVGLGGHQAELPVIPEDRVNPEDLPLAQRFPVGDVIRVVAGADLPAEGLDAALEADPNAARLRFLPSAEGGFVAIDPATREVVAMVGGYSFRVSRFNRAVQARRQTGSAFKPFVYTAAIDSRLFTPATIVRDEPTPFRLPGGRLWNPQNSDGEYLGPIPLRDALARSRNVVSVRLVEELGLRRVQEVARAAGFRSTLTDNLTLALGSSEVSPLELVNGITTLAAGGLVDDPILVTEVTDVDGLVYAQTYDPEPAIDPAVAYIVTDLMTSVVERGTGRRARELGRPAAGKTGTTNEARDAWFVGFVPQLVAGAWVGHDDYRPLGRGEYGGRAALPVWLRYMQTVLEGEPVLDFQRPEVGIVERRIDPATGLLAQPDADDGVVEIFLEGSEPTRYAPRDGTPAADEVLLRQRPPATDPSDPLYDGF